MNRSSGEPSSLSPSSRMGLASISWNSVRVFSKSRTGLFRVLYQGTRFGTAKRIAYAHSIVGTPVSETVDSLLGGVPANGGLATRPLRWLATEIEEDAFSR